MLQRLVVSSANKNGHHDAHPTAASCATLQGAFNLTGVAVAKKNKKRKPTKFNKKIPDIPRKNAKKEAKDGQGLPEIQYR
jgi:hypothetical protein